jgi:filamentous hemagglutinin
VVYLANNQTTLAGNSGATLSAGGHLILVSAGTITNNGAITSRGAATLLAGGDYDSAAGSLTGASVDLQVGGSINLTATDAPVSTGWSQAAGADVLGGDAHNLASVTATSGDLVMQAGGDITSQGAQISAAGTASLLAGGSISLGAVTDSLNTLSGSLIPNGLQTVTSDLQTVRGTSITAGGDITVAAGLTNPAGTVTGDATNIASTAGNVVVSGVSRPIVQSAPPV